MRIETSKRIQKIAFYTAAILAVVGYLYVGSLVPDSGCPAYSYNQFTLHCSFVQGLVYRLGNFAKMMGALAFALPALVVGFWAMSREGG